MCVAEGLGAWEGRQEGIEGIEGIEEAFRVLEAKPDRYHRTGAERSDRGGWAGMAMAMASQEWEVAATWNVAQSHHLLSNHVSVRQDALLSLPHAPDRICLLPGPEKQPCEITVRFQRQLHIIHRIRVLSSARTCEVYRQNEGDTDVEYLCTTRGQLQVVPSGHEVVDGALGSKAQISKLLYDTDMEFDDPDPCVSVTIRLLSLEDKSQVIIGCIAIVATLGSFLAGWSSSIPPPPMQKTGRSEVGVGGSSLGALAPLMLQMAQGFSMPDLRNKMAFINGVSAEGLADRTPSQRMTKPQEEHIMQAMASQLGTTSEGEGVPSDSVSSTKTDAALQGICQRLENLEAVCARIETSLMKTMESFDKRLQILEAGCSLSSGI